MAGDRQDSVRRGDRGFLRRRRRLFVVGVVVAALAAAALALRPVRHNASSHRLVAGGFELTLPAGWVATPVEEDQPTQWFRAEHRTVAAAPTAWLWVNRYNAADNALDDERLRADREADGADVLSIRDVRIADRTGKQVRYRVRPRRMPEWLPAPRLSAVAYHVEFAGHVYQLGLAGWPRPPTDDAERAVADFELFDPEGWRTVVRNDDGFDVAIPAHWNGDVSDLGAPGALYGAFPPRPQDAWLYVIRGRADSVREMVATAARNIEAAGGQILDRRDDTLAGQPATRIDFLFPNTQPGMPEMAHDVEWFVEDNRGRVLILAVGRNDPSSTIAEDIADRFRLH